MSDNLGTKPFKKGLHDLGNGVYAWLQPDGGWGWSNAGLVVDGDESLLVDTLFDLKLTAQMLRSMKSAEPKATNKFDKLVNTHANGDHCFGNELVKAAEIIASKATAREMSQQTAESLAQMMSGTATMGEIGEFFTHAFGAFDFTGITTTLPTVTFEGEKSVRIGDKHINLIQVGPAHTEGDILAHVIEDKTVFTGDILFIEGHPIIWVGPISNWISGCDRILDMDVDTVVPGHGPITDKRGVHAVKDYLEYINVEARKRYDEGMDSFEAARDINLSDYSSWGDAERIAVNVATLYTEYSGKTDAHGMELWRRMALLKKERR